MSRKWFWYPSDEAMLENANFSKSDLKNLWNARKAYSQIWPLLTLPLLLTFGAFVSDSTGGLGFDKDALFDPGDIAKGNDVAEGSVRFAKVIGGAASLYGTALLTRRIGFNTGRASGYTDIGDDDKFVADKTQNAENSANFQSSPVGFAVGYGPAALLSIVGLIQATGAEHDPGAAGLMALGLLWAAGHEFFLGRNNGYFGVTRNRVTRKGAIVADVGAH